MVRKKDNRERLNHRFNIMDDLSLRTMTTHKSRWILKGKVICGCYGSKMQRRRGTNRVNLYFFTCLTNNRVGVDRYMGMYVREEDIFSAIYYQLKGYIKSRSGFSVEYGSKRRNLNKKLLSVRPYYPIFHLNEVCGSMSGLLKTN